MPDHFEELGLPRRVWLELEEIKARFLVLSAERHPDAGGSAEQFSRLNEAMRVLSEPSLRVKHWLELSGQVITRGTVLDTEMQELFMEIGAVLQSVKKWRDKNGGALSPLAKALLAGEKQALAQKTAKISERVQQGESRLIETLKATDRPEELADLAERLSFCAKWLKQLHEARFSLSGD